MNNRLCHGKVVVFTTFYQFFSTYVNEFRISLCPTTLHWRQENICWAKHDIFIDTALQQSCVSSATAALLSCFNVSALGVRGTLEVLPPQRSPIAEDAHGSCFCHYILALWSLSPFSGDFFFFGLRCASCTILLWKDAECGICVMTWWSHGNRLWDHQCQMVNSFRHTSERTAVLCYRKSLLQNCFSLSSQKIEKMADKIFPPLLFVLSRSHFRSPTAPMWETKHVSPECKSAL